MSLLARHFESLGLPTLIVGSALDILESGRPPRAQFLDFPLGFETGPFKDKHRQLEVVREALKGFESFKSSGIRPLPFRWPEGWDLVKNREGKTDNDQRSPRNTEPQYQTDEDRWAAENQ
ncbi:MAG: hypothetical protein JKY88_09440 [Pseudomonadales bacterium]|nr:hypothetical protein [Pseudomonadales bacterium]